jgi:archaellum component FlaC
MAVAQLLKIAHNIDKKVTGVGDGVRGVDEKVQVVNDNVKAIDNVVQTIADGGLSVFSLSPASSLTFFLSSDSEEVKETTTKVKSIVQQTADDVDDVKCS